MTTGRPSRPPAVPPQTAAPDIAGLFASSPCLLVVLDPAGRIVEWNEACTLLSGYELDEVRGRPVWDILAPEGQAERWRATKRRIFEAGEEPARDGQWATRFGERRFVRWAAAVDRTGAPEEARMLVSAVDLTDLFSTRQALDHLADQERTIFDRLPVLLSVQDPGGRFLFGNRRFREIFHFEGPLDGKLPAELFGPELAARFENLQELAREGSARIIEESFDLAGRRLELVTSILPLFDDDGRFEGACALSDDRTEARATARLLELRSREVADLSQRLIAAEEDERRRIARELHDGINQEVASLAVELGMLAVDESPPSGSGGYSVRELSERAMQISDQVRQLSHQLHPSTLETLGLSDALRSFAMSVRKRPDVHLDYYIDDVPPILSLLVATCIYRIAQEAVHNAVRHAEASGIRLSLRLEGQALRLVVEDDGKGFDPETVQAGLGFVGMRERARMANGALSIRSAPGGGARISFKTSLADQPPTGNAS
ncbi:MAG: PAS domain-containing protein [Acidobacteria bacterium]|nr:PAS domain-containing protein [Acidobacteriota bacterium]